MDGTIQRFEFVFELLWKTMKAMMEIEGIQTRTPREVLRMAYQIEWLDSEDTWLQMLQDRNDTSHSYDPEVAARIYADIRDHFPQMKNLVGFLTRRLTSRKE